MPFWIFGGIGMLWAVVLAIGLGETRRVEDKASCQKQNPDGRATCPQADVTRKPSLREAFTVFIANPSALLLAAGLGMMIYVDVGFKTWMPSHLSSTFGIAKGSAALNAVLWHYIGAFVGVTLGARLSDRLVSRRPSVRMETNIAGLALAVPFIAWMAYAPSLVVCCVAMALFGVFRGVYDSNLMASLFDIIPQKYHASGAGIMLSFAFVFGSTSPVVLGFLKDSFSSSTGLASLAAFYLAGAAIIAVARKKSYNGRQQQGTNKCHH